MKSPLILAALAVLQAQAATAKANDPLIGFTCLSKDGQLPPLLFNLDIKKRKWIKANGEVSELEMSANEARMPTDTALFSLGIVSSTALDRTTLRLVEFTMKTDGSFRRRVEYQCQKMPPHAFGLNRKF